MKRTLLLFGLAFAFISFVLIFVLSRGVHLPERKVVKWSQVRSPVQAGAKIARFLFPEFKAFSGLAVHGKGEFPKEFSTALVEEINRLGGKLTLSDGARVKIEFVDLMAANLKDQCQGGLRSSCLGQKALEKLLNKQNDPRGLWVKMDRVSATNFYFYYYNKP